MFVSFICNVVLAVVASVVATAGQAEELAAPPLVTRLVNFQALPDGPRVSGVFRMPQAPTAGAGVVILHGSAGMDSRGSMHALDLARVGIATLEIDMWGARGIAGGAQSRPARVHDSLPDLWGALAWLAKQPGIDHRRLGVLGFSWGGAMTMLAATRRYGQPATAGHHAAAAGVAFYPVCWGYNRVPSYDLGDLRDAPLLILAGGKDGYDDDANACPSLVAGLSEAERQRTTVKVFPGVKHGFNMLEPAIRFSDAFAHRGKGGETESAPDASARDEARRLVTQYFTETLSNPESRPAK